MSLIYTYPDGTVYLERPNSRWGRVKMQYDPFDYPNHANEVMACAIQDTIPPRGIMKGEKFFIALDWFRYLDNFHTEQAHNWLWTPNSLWTNDAFVGDKKGGSVENGAKPSPLLECLTFPLNIRRVIGETLSHYEVWSLPVDEDPRNYNPAVFNFRNYPWIFALAQSRTKDFHVQKVGAGLDVYHMNVRHPAKRHYIHKSEMVMFRQPPFTVSDGIYIHEIVDYMFVGVSIYGITGTGKRIPLLISEKPGQWDFCTDWRCEGFGVIPPA